MSDLVSSRHPITEKAVQLAPKSGYLLTLALTAIGAALYVSNTRIGLVLLSVGCTLLVLIAVIGHLDRQHYNTQSKLQKTVASFVELDASPSFSTDMVGLITYRNKAASKRFGATTDTLLASLGDIFASPSLTLQQLQRNARVNGFAREDVVLRRGHMRLSVHQVGTTGFLWRLEDILERANSGRGGEGISLPMMTVSKAGTVLFMNEPMRRLLGGRTARLDDIINDLPLRPGKLHEIACAEGPMKSQICVVDGLAGRKEVFLIPSADTIASTPNDWNLFDELPVPLMKVVPNGKILLCNSLARDLLANKEPQGKYLGDMIEGLGRSVADWLSEASENEGELRSEFVRASGQPKDVFLQVALTRVVE